MSAMRQGESRLFRGRPWPARNTWRIVIAEDETLPAELLKRSLVRLGHSVLGIAQNGLEALALARETRPDAVLMDLRMPVMDGWTAMAELVRENLAPVVVVSALDDRDAVEQATAAGASAFLTKPVREDDLERALELAVARFMDWQEIRKWRVAAEHRALELEQALEELREVQLQLVTAARRAAVASLAHGLTHEINNALTPILASAQMIGLAHGDNPETVERAAAIVLHARRIAGWIASLRQMSMGERGTRLAYSLNELLRDILELYADRLRRNGIEVTAALDPDLPVMEGYPDQLRELWMNLVQNAVEAMPDGGTLSATSRHLPGMGLIVTTLTDSGSGIAPDHLSLVLEPGFTTKAGPGQVSGLGWGLYTAHKIAQAHGGTLEISSPPEGAARGTRVQLTFPTLPSPAT